MSGKKSAEPSPQSIARADRMRLASEEGAKAMADLERQRVAVRKNMERLRTLRKAKEAEEAEAQPVLAKAVKKRKKPDLK
jgi:hypothetical protein